MTEVGHPSRMGELPVTGLTQGAVEAPRAGDVDDVGGNAFLVQSARRGNGLRHHDAAGRDLNGVPYWEVGSVNATIDDAIATAEDVTPQLFLTESGQGVVHQLLIDRLGRESEV